MKLPKAMTIRGPLDGHSSPNHDGDWSQATAAETAQRATDQMASRSGGASPGMRCIAEILHRQMRKPIVEGNLSQRAVGVPG